MLLWVLFIAFIIIALALDLGVFHRVPHEVSTKEAATWSAIWISCALLFSGVVYLSFLHGWVDNPTELTPRTAVVKYITGYLVELSLSVDNIFVIALIFSSFGIPRKYQHEVLFYGVLGAIVFRATMIFFGVSLIHRFDWVVYVFGLFLLYTALKLLLQKGGEADPRNSRIFRVIQRLYPTTHKVEGDHFFVKIDGVRHATPLLVALVIIEFMDLAFAVDSIPAVLAISSDPLIVFSSNILAVMGLRSMFFFISSMIHKFRYINYSLVAILAFVGLKLILSHHVEFPEWLSLSVILLSLGAGILASSLRPPPSAAE